jgi:hypothetical protein
MGSGIDLCDGRAGKAAVRAAGLCVVFELLEGSRTGEDVDGWTDARELGRFVGTACDAVFAGATEVRDAERSWSTDQGFS